MKKFLIILAFFPLSLFSQQSVLSSFNGYGDIVNVIDVDPTDSLFTIEINNFYGSPRFQPFGPWIAQDVQVGMVMWVDCARFVITNVNSASFSTMNIDVKVPSVDWNLGVATPLPNSRCAVVFEDQYLLTALPAPADGNSGALSGINNTLFACMLNHYSQALLVTKNSVNEITDYVAGLDTIPSEAPGPNIGETWRNSVGQLFYSNGTQWLTDKEVKFSNASLEGLPSYLYKLGIDTLGQDTLYISNNGIFRRFQSGLVYKEGYGINIFATDSIEVDTNQIATQYDISLLPTGIDTFQLNNDTLKLSLVNDFEPFKKVILPVVGISPGTGISTSSISGVHTITNTGDLSNTNELQTLSTGTNTLTLSGGGGTVTVDTDPTNDITTSTIAGGDLTGTYPNPTVAKINGMPVNNTAPGLGSTLMWNGTQWIRGEILYRFGTQNNSIGIGTNINYSGKTYNRVIAIGTGSGNGLTFGEENTFIGHSAGSGFTTGSGNVAIGDIALFNINGDYNFGLGKSTFQATTGGLTVNNSVAIGYQAGSNISSNISNVIAIGYQAGRNRSLSNALYIESGSGTPLISGNFSTNRAGINIEPSDINATFHVLSSGTSSSTWTAQFHNSTTGGNNALMIRDDGNIGLSTNAPAQTLHVAGTMRLTGNAGTATEALGRNASGDISGVPFSTIVTSGGGLTGNGVVNYLSQYNSTSTLDTTGIIWVGGRMGIGTNAPTDQLHTTGSVRLQNYPNTLNSTGNPVNVLSTSSTGVVESHPISEVISSAGGITGSGVNGQVSFWTGAQTQGGNSNFLWDNTSSLLRVNGGIGVNRDPFGGRAIDITGGGIRLTGSTSGSFEVNGGNSSFNVTTTGGQESILLTDNTRARISMAGNSYKYEFQVDDVRFRIRDRTAGDLDRLTILANGSVGISAVTPIARLHVAGSSALSADRAVLVTDNATTPLNLFEIRNNGDIYFNDYPNTLNTTGNPVNVLSTGTDGLLQSHPISEVISSAGGVTGSGVAGQVTFWNGTSTQSGDNGLFWDNTNKRLGVGITTPQSSIHVANGGIFQRSSNDISSPVIFFRKTRGTIASPLAVQSGDLLGTFGFDGLLSNNVTFSADFSFFGGQAAAAPTATTLPINIFFKVGSTAAPYNASFYIHHSGRSRFGTNNMLSALPQPNAKLEVVGEGETSGTTAFLVRNGAATPANLLSVLDNGDVGIGTNAPGARLQINGSGITSSTNSLRLVDNNSIQYFNAADDGQLTLGKNITLSTALAYRVFQGNPILTNTVSGGLSQDVAFFSGGLTYAGSEPFFGARAMQFAASNRNTATSNQIWGAYFVAQNETTTARASLIRGMDIILINNATGGTIGEVTGIRVVLPTHAVGSTISNTTGISIADLTPTTAGTQTNVYSISSSDENARMYHAGNVGIGSGVQSPTRTLDINGETRIRDLTTTTATGLVGADADGVLSNVTFASAVSQGGGLTGSGVTNYLAQYNSSNTLDTTGIIWTGGRMGIGTATPSARLNVFGSAASHGISTNVGYNIQLVTAPTFLTTDLTLQAGGVMTPGQHFIGVAYYNAFGQTEVSTRRGITTTVSNASVLINLPISSDPTVIGRRVFLSNVGEGSSYGKMIADIPNNTQTTYLINVADDPAGTPLIFSTPNLTSNFISVNGTRSLVLSSSLVTVGPGNGNANITGPMNIIVGSLSGTSITTGGYNTILGGSIGNTITTGSGNFLVGINTGQLTTGSDNIFLGRFVNQYGGGALNHNTAIGYAAIRDLASGDENIAIGRSALGSLDIGNSNTAVGSYAAFTLDTLSSNNVFIGALAGAFVGAAGSVSYSTVNSSIFIGNTTRTLADNLSNQIVIGNNSITLGSNTTRIGNSNTVQTHLDGRLTVGNTLYDANTTARIVGLNNTSSTYALVVTNSTAGTNTTSAPALVVTNEQRVGVGTYSPTDLFHVRGTGVSTSGRTWIKVENTQTNSATGAKFTNGNGRSATFQYSGSDYPTGESFSVGTSADYPVVFITNGDIQTGGASYIAFQPGGYLQNQIFRAYKEGVSISNTGAGAPAKTLHVTGEVRISDLDNGVATRIVGATADGDLDELTLGSGLSITSGTISVTNPISASEVFIESSTATTIDLDANTGVVKDVNGTNVNFTLPTDLSRLNVYKNGIRLARTGSATTRDFSVNTGTNEITFTTALLSTDRIVIVKI